MHEAKIELEYGPNYEQLANASINPKGLLLCDFYMINRNKLILDLLLELVFTSKIFCR